MSFEDDLTVFLEVLFWAFIASLILALIIVTVKCGIITYICCKQDELTQVPTIVPVNTVSYTVPVDGQQQINMESVPIQPIAQPVEQHAVECEGNDFTRGTNLSDQPPAYTEIVINKV